MLHVDISLRGLQENLLDTVGFFWLNSRRWFLSSLVQEVGFHRLRCLP